MKIYDLRREPVMRAARKYVVSEFWPQNYEEFKAVVTGYGTEPNAWFRQVLTYWNMVAALVLRGAVNEQLFFETNNEPYFLWAKFGEYIRAGKERPDRSRVPFAPGKIDLQAGCEETDQGLAGTARRAPRPGRRGRRQSGKVVMFVLDQFVADCRAACTFLRSARRSACRTEKSTRISARDAEWSAYPTQPPTSASPATEERHGACRLR